MNNEPIRLLTFAKPKYGEQIVAAAPPGSCGMNIALFDAVPLFNGNTEAAKDFAEKFVAQMNLSGSVRVRHKKRGSFYWVIGQASVQAGCDVREGDVLTVYRGEDRRLWARPYPEFHDGRFEFVPAHDQPVQPSAQVSTLADADTVIAEIAEALQCKPDNEEILAAIGRLQKKAGEAP